MSGICDPAISAIMEALRAAAAREILPRFQALAADAVRPKSAPDDLVTDADIGAERLLTERLGSALAADSVVGEEAVAADPGLLGRLKEPGRVVVIDPVDGTWNFANGLPVFGTIVALVVNGETEIGIIHFPVVGDFLVARRGGGAWHVDARDNWSRLSVASAAPLDEMSGLISLHLFPMEERKRLAPRVCAFARTSTFRCSAYEYRLIAQGSLAFSLNAGLMPWDHAAGVLIHREAGGYSALVTGESYTPAMTVGFLLLAPDRESWWAVRDAFLEPGRN